ncbi:MAG: ABC transporter ATP-binding protein [Solibacillus sp.]|jgi:ABC-2 type transport system ATP-binding protein|uniref:ABC transporter ATP-binding protein n=1 Tax=unclassified Solibacillus TaxID=2637870 RepID=UPI0030F7538A
MKIEVCNITKKYKEHVVLNNLSFTIEEPSIIGFLGHNGAGKTTFLNILSGLIPATSGEININNQLVFNNSAVLQDICFIAETDNFQLEMTVEQTLKANHYFYPNWDNQLAKQLICEFSLPLKGKIKNLSKGMVSALGIIVGLASQAKITIFDEPYIGLDVAARSKFYDLLLEQQDMNPRQFILSTHLIDEVSSIFDKVIIVQEGNLLLYKDFIDWDETIISVRGHKEAVDMVASKHTVLYEQLFMNEKMAVLYVTNSDAHFDTVKVERLSIQDLLVYLSKKNKGGIAI